MKMKRLLALTVSFLLALSLPQTAFADTWNLNNGKIIINVNDKGEQRITQDGSASSSASSMVIDSNPTITGGDGSQTIIINAEGGKKASLTIDGINAKQIDVGEYDATITVKGTNTVGSSSSGDNAGIHVSSGSVTIQGDTGSKLTATSKNGAGIGSDKSSKSNSYEEMSGSITINGSVEVEGKSTSGAGIGSGDHGEMSGSISIGGNADVDGTSSGNGAGIGTGDSGKMSGSISIGGSAQVDGTSSYGAGIGTGGNWADLSGSISIGDHANVTGNGGKHGAGIGTGYESDLSGSITIGGKAQVKGTSSDSGNDGYGAGIGTGSYSDISGNITIDNRVNVTGNSTYGAGIGSGNEGKMSGSIAISNKATVTAASEEGNAIGAGKYAEMTGTITYFDPVEPSPSTYYPAYRVEVQDTDGDPVFHSEEICGTVLTIALDADYAKLVGSIDMLKALREQGVTTIVFATSGVTSTFDVDDLIARGSGSFALIHNGASAVFFLNNDDITKLLK